MTTHIGNEGSVTVGGNVMGEVVSFSLTENAAIVDDSQLSDAADTNLAGSTNFGIEITAMFDPADTAQAASLVGLSLAFVVYPIGSTSGKPSASGAARIESISKRNERNARLEVTFQARGNGALTWGTV